MCYSDGFGKVSRSTIAWVDGLNGEVLKESSNSFIRLNVGHIYQIMTLKQYPITRIIGQLFQGMKLGVVCLVCFSIFSIIFIGVFLDQMSPINSVSDQISALRPC